MNKYTKKFIRNTKARVLPFTTMVLLIVAILSTIIFISEPIGAVPTTIDSFEDGDYTSDPQWNVSTTAGGSFAVDTSQPKSGSYCLNVTTDGANDNGEVTMYLNRTFVNGYTYSMWVYFDDGAYANTKLEFSDYTHNDFAMIQFKDDNIQYNGDDIGAVVLKNDYLANTWYKCSIDYYSNGTMNISVYETGVAYYNATWVSPSSDTLFDYVRIQSYDDDEATGVQHYWWDLLEYDDGTPSNVSHFGIINSYLDSGYVTWTGASNTTVYSNETAGVGNNVTIYTDVNVSENCTDIYIDLSGDLTFGDNDEVNFTTGGGSTMYLQVGTDDTWSDEWVMFNSTNYYNISLNTSWDSLSDDANPFTINESSGNITIHCIFRLDLASGISSGTYLTSSISVWKVAHKYETTW